MSLPKKILLVEFDETAAQADAGQLRGLGYDVSVALTTAEAIQRAGDPCFDLVVVDPDPGQAASGARLALEIWQARRLPVVYWTACADEEKLSAMCAPGHSGIVIKGAGCIALQSTLGIAFDLHEALQKAEENELKFRSIADYSRDWEYLIDPSGKVIYSSPAMQKITGYSGGDFLSDPGLYDGMFHPDDRERVLEHLNLEAAMLAERSEASAALEFRIIAKDGRVRWINHECRCVIAGDGRCLGLRGSNRDITEQKTIALQIERSQKIQRDASELAHLGYYEIDLDTLQASISDEVYRMLGVAPVSEPIDRDFYLRYIHPEDIQLVTEMYHQAVAEHTPVDFQYRIIRADGETGYVHSRGRVEIDLDGNNPRLFGTLLDISLMKSAEDEVLRLLREKDLLMREIHHRIKNNLATLTTLLALQAGEMSEPSAVEALQDARGRIMSMMAVYDRLYRSPDLKRVLLSDYLKTLVNEIVATWRGVSGRVHLEMDIAAIAISVDLAFPLGVIVNELVTNALKYAFPRGAYGIVRVVLKEGGGRTLDLRVIDNGVGLPEEVDFEHPDTFGLNLVQLMIGQLHASVNIISKGGTEFRMSIPY